MKEEMRDRKSSTGQGRRWKERPSYLLFTEWGQEGTSDWVLSSSSFGFTVRGEMNETEESVKTEAREEEMN